MKKVTLVLGVVLFVALSAGLSGQTSDGLAELHVQKIVLDPPSAVTRGQDVEIYARIANTGTRSAEHFTVGFFYRPAREGEPWILLDLVEEEHLRPSQQDFLEVTYVFETLEIELGTYEIKVVADVSNQTPEIDELNNELITTMQLVTSTLGLPELQPLDMAFQQLPPPDDGKWEITVNVKNLGEDAQSFFKVQFFIDDDPFDPTLGESAATTKVVPPSGQQVSAAGTLNPTTRNLEPGSYRITAVIDVDEQVAEQDEGNNTISAWLTIKSVELHPESLEFDLPVVRLDEEVRITSRIANSGEGIAKNVLVDFRIDGLRFASARIDQLGSEPQEVAVTLNANRLGLADAPKVYDISVEVDPEDALRESDEANNEIVRTMTILPPEPKKAELHPESLILSPASPAEQGRADVVTVTSVVRNTGRSESGPFDVGFYYRVKGGRRWVLFPCSDPSSCSEIELAAGSDATLVGTLPVLTLSPGVYEIRVLADVESAVDELDETNNDLVTTLTLLASRLPDLAFCPEGGIVREPLGDVQQGQTIRLSACIINLGEQSAGPFTVRFSYCPLTSSIDGTSTAAQCSELYSQSFFTPAPEIAVPGLAIGESVTVPVILESRDLLPQQYQIRVEIDPAGAVRERDSFNNVLETQVTVLGPDLTIATLATSPEDAIDQTQVDTVEVAATVLNIGVVPTGEFTVRFRLSRVEELGPVAVRVHSCDDTDASSCHEADYFGVVTLPGIGVLVPEQVRCTIDLEEADLPPGQYIITAEVDCEGDVDGDGVCEGRVAEHNEVNNALQIPIILVGTRLPDLAVDSLTTEPAAFADWQTTDSIGVIATISNIGVKAADPFDVLLRVFRVDPLVNCDGRVPLECAELVYTAARSLVGMIRDDVRDVVWSLNRSVFQDPGRYILRVDVDCDRIVDGECVGRVSESNEANNSAELTCEIGEAPYTPPGPTCVGECPDLKVRSLSARLESGSTGTARVTATIENIGTADAGPFTVTAYYVPARGADPVAVVDTRHRTRYEGLAADETATFRQDFDASALPNGFYDVFVVVDVDNEVLESNENNNTKDEALWIH